MRADDSIKGSSRFGYAGALSRRRAGSRRASYRVRYRIDDQQHALVIQSFRHRSSAHR